MRGLVAAVERRALMQPAAAAAAQSGLEVRDVGWWLVGWVCAFEWVFTHACKFVHASAITRMRVHFDDQAAAGASSPDLLNIALLHLQQRHAINTQLQCMCWGRGRLHVV